MMAAHYGSALLSYDMSQQEPDR